MRISCERDRDRPEEKKSASPSHHDMRKHSGKTSQVGVVFLGLVFVWVFTLLTLFVKFPKLSFQKTPG